MKPRTPPALSLSTLAGVALSAAAALFAPGCKGEAEKTAPAESASARPFALPEAQRDRIGVAPVASGSLHRTVRTTGTVAFLQNRSTHVVSPMSGTVVELLVPLGATVKSGTLIANVASPDFAAAVSAYRKAAVVGENLRRIVETDKELVKSGNIGRRELDQATVDAASADADRDAALEQLRALGIPPRELGAVVGGRVASAAVLRAPMDGTVVELLITPGQLLEGGATDCFTVADLDRMWIMASVFEADLPFVKVGDTADISIGGGPRTTPGTVEYVSDLVDPATRAIAVRIVADNPERILKKDGFVDVTLHSAADETGLVLPVSAVLLDAESLPFVFVANPDHSYSRRRVTTGVRSGDRVQITEGLVTGEPVVTEGGLFVQFAETQ